MITIMLIVYKEMILTAVKRIITKVDFDYGKFKEDLISLH